MSDQDILSDVERESALTKKGRLNVEILVICFPGALETFLLTKCLRLEDASQQVCLGYCGAIRASGKQISNNLLFIEGSRHNL